MLTSEVVMPPPVLEKASRGQSNLVQGLPFFLALFATTVFFQQVDFQTALHHGDPFRQVIFGTIYVFALILLLRRFGSSVSLAKDNLAYVAFLFYYLASIAWSNSPYRVLLTWGHVFGFFLICLSAVPAYTHREAALLKMLMFYGAVGMVLNLLTVWFMPGRGIDEGGRWMGLSSHPNVFGIMALISVWASASFFLYSKTFKGKLASVMLLILSGVSLYGSNSMTSILLSVFSLLAIPLLMLVNRKGVMPRVMKILFLFLFLIFVLSALYLVAPDIFSVDRFFKGIGRSETFTGRTKVWELGMVAFYDKPWLGWSFDNLRSLMVKYPLYYNHLHNGYLDILVRGGIVGLLFIIYFIVKIMVYLMQLSQKDIKATVIFFVLFLVILLHNVTEASYARSPSLFWLMFSFLYFHLQRSTKPAFNGR